jgi:hypothetical protein
MAKRLHRLGRFKPLQSLFFTRTTMTTLSLFSTRFASQLIAACLCALSTHTATAQTAVPQANPAFASELIAAFAKATDTSDAATLEGLLHPAFRVIFNLKAGTNPSVLDRTQYLKMVRDGKIGGANRQVSVAGVSALDGFATASARMVRPDASFQGVYAMIQSNGQWQLLQESVLMTVTPKAP